jgi:hypothetical protein
MQFVGYLLPFILVSLFFDKAYGQSSQTVSSICRIVLSSATQQQLQIVTQGGAAPGGAYFGNSKMMQLYSCLLYFYGQANGITQPQYGAFASDYRIKDDIKQLDDTFSVKNLNPISYKNLLTNQQELGLLAHELQEHYPELVTGEKDGPEIQKVNYIGLIPILINEIKILEKRVEDLEK